MHRQSDRRRRGERGGESDHRSPRSRVVHGPDAGHGEERAVGVLLVCQVDCALAAGQVHDLVAHALQASHIHPIEGVACRVLGDVGVGVFDLDARDTTTSEGGDLAVVLPVGCRFGPSATGLATLSA